MKRMVLLIISFGLLFTLSVFAADTEAVNFSSTGTDPCSVTINQDLTFTIPNAIYDAGLSVGQRELKVNFQFFGEQNGQLLWQLGDVDSSPSSTSCSISIASDLSFTLTDAVYDAGPLGGKMTLQADFQYSGEQNGVLLWYLSDIKVDNQPTDPTPDPPQSDCGAYVTPGVWKQFDCYNLAAIGKTTNDDPFTPSWRLIGGYWQWGRKGPASSQWYDTNTEHFAHGPTGPGSSEANSGEISGWDSSYPPDSAWSDSYKTVNDPCTAGYRVPTKSQWDGVLDNNTQSTVGSWLPNATNYSSARKFGDALMLPATGYRYRFNPVGALSLRGKYGCYWSSSANGSNDAWYMDFYNDIAETDSHNHHYGRSIRCIADDSSQPLPLSLGKNTLSLESGNTETITISGGTGYYTVSTNNSQVVTAIIAGSSVEISGLSSGTATITVEDTGGKTVSISVTVSSASVGSGDCGAYVAPGVWKDFDCYNLAAIGKTTNDDPFTPSWRLIGGYWQWGRKGPDPSDWFDTNTMHFAHGPTGPDSGDANSGTISGWDGSNAPDGAWLDASKTTNDPCPAGFRVPTKAQWDGILGNNTQSTVGTWSNSAINYSSARAFGDKLMLPTAGYRDYSSGTSIYRGINGQYWSSSEDGGYTAWNLYFSSDSADTRYSTRKWGFSVRCVSE